MGKDQSSSKRQNKIVHFIRPARPSMGDAVSKSALIGEWIDPAFADLAAENLRLRLVIRSAQQVCGCDKAMAILKSALIDKDAAG
jgi:hypothetical protein